MKGFIGPSGKLLCLKQTQKIMQHIHGLIPKMFGCWSDPVVHDLLLTNSIEWNGISDGFVDRTLILCSNMFDFRHDTVCLFL